MTHTPDFHTTDGGVTIICSCGWLSPQCDSDATAYEALGEHVFGLVTA